MIQTLVQTIDFQRSFLTFRVDLQQQAAITLSHKPPTTLNNARIQIECCCQLTHLESGATTKYILGASCKTERVGGEENLWLEPNADFCLVASQDEFLVLKSWARKGVGVLRHPPELGLQPERQSGAVRDAWTAFRINVCRREGRELQSVDEIINATFRDAPLVCQTEYSEGGYRVRLEHPIKTFNVSEREEVYQTDTGPVVLPNFSEERKAERVVERFDLAYSAFNAPDWADFIINVPTRVADDAEVNHYSRSRRITNTENKIIEIT